MDDEYQSLVQFLYRVPVGLIEFVQDGQIVMMNPKAAQLLMPVSQTGGLDNLYTALSHAAPNLPDIVGRVSNSFSVETIRFSTRTQKRDRSESVLSLSVFGSGNETVTAVLHDATQEVRRQNRRIEAARTVDAITRLPNNLAALQHLVSMQGRSGVDPAPGSIIYIGLDRFQQVNDAAGSSGGDLVLALTAARLVAATQACEPDFADTTTDGPREISVSPASPFVARVGGDEFALILRSTDSFALTHLALQLLQVVQEPVCTSATSFQCTCSIGVLEAVEPEATAQENLYRARLAMTAAKQAGGNRFERFEPSMGLRAQERGSLEAQLRGALARGELFVVYQPVVGLVDDSLQAVEALVRWNHPTLGLVPPGEFIGIAEESGLIDGIGTFVLRSACVQFMRWQALYGNRAPKLMAVNLSRAQLPRTDLASEIAQILRDTGMSPASLQLEVTESMAAQNAAMQMRLHELKSLGVSLALDDFGTGFSALSSLHELPVDLLKIDRSFVSQLEYSAHHRVLVEATLRIARSLCLRTVAEGVETQAQARLLRDMECEKVQGYLISRPLTLEQFDAWMVTRP